MVTQPSYAALASWLAVRLSSQDFYYFEKKSPYSQVKYQQEGSYML